MRTIGNHSPEVHTIPVLFGICQQKHCFMPTSSCRFMLIQSHSSSDRLRREIGFMQALGAIRCRSCRARLAAAGDALAMTEEGVGGAFVNSHGYVHDMATFSAITDQSVVYQVWICFVQCVDRLYTRCGLIGLFKGFTPAGCLPADSRGCSIPLAGTTRDGAQLVPGL